MSLFKAREWWCTTVGENELFDLGCLCVADVTCTHSGWLYTSRLTAHATELIYSTYVLIIVHIYTVSQKTSPFLLLR